MSLGLNYDLGKIFVRIGAIDTEFQRTISKTYATLNSMTDKLNRIGTQMTLGITLPLMGVGTAAVVEFGKFDKAMTQSLAIMKGMTPQLRREMASIADSISLKGVTNATELARSYYYLASAGLDAQQAMSSLSAINNFAIAGQFDMAKATTLAMDAQSAMGMVDKDAIKNRANLVKITDMLVGANILANASTEEFSMALTSQAGAIMRSYKVPLEEGLGVLAAYAEQGRKGEEAGRMFARMLSFTMRGFRENRKVWDAFGVSIFKANGELVTMDSLVRQLSMALSKLSTEQKGAALEAMGFQTESQATILPLINMQDKIKGYTERLREMSGLQDKIKGYTERLGEMGGVTESVANEQMKNLSDQFAITGNYVQALGRDIGSILSPSLEVLNKDVRGVLTWWRSLDNSTQKLIVQFGLVAAAAGPALLVLSFGAKAATMAFAAMSLPLVKVVALVLLLKSAVDDVGAVLSGTTSKGGGLGTYFYNEFAIVQQSGAVVFAYLMEGWEYVKFGFKEAVSGMKWIWNEFSLSIRQSMAGILQSFGTFVQRMETTINKLPGVDKASLGSQSIMDAAMGVLPGPGGNSAAGEFAKNKQDLEKGLAEIDAILTQHAIDVVQEFEGEDRQGKSIIENVFGTEGGVKAVEDALGGLKETMDGLMQSSIDMPTQYKQEMDDMLEALDAELQLVGYTNDARERAIELIKFKKLAEQQYGKETIAYLKAIERYESKINELATAQRNEKFQQIRDWAQDATSVWANLQETAVHALDGISREFTDMIVDGEADFKRFAKGILKELLNMVIQIQMARALMTVFPGLGMGYGGNSGTTWAGGNATTTTSTGAYVAHSGGQVGKISRMRSVNPAIFNGAPRLHSGLASDEFPTILQKNETVIPAGGKALSVAPSVVINNNTGQQMEQEGQPKFDGEKWVVSVVAKNLDSGGTLFRKVKGMR
jgi:TP901 family phage tail tape measure protein